MMSISNLFISNAFAEGAATGSPGSIADFIPLIAMVAVFYFLVLRPQMKRSKEMKVMIAALQKGDEIVSNGGVVGRVVKVGESYVTMEAAEGVNLIIQKGAIQSVLPKGTLKSIN
jgi:preprotein translocase subunit YajC